MEPVYIFGIITALFFVLLVLKNILKWKKVCTLCIAVSLTWIFLLATYLLGIFENKTIMAILMGHTSLGIFYLWEERAKEKFKIFRLPLLLSFIFIIYTTLETFYLNSLMLLTALWLIFLLIYLFRTDKKFGSFVNKLIECCKKW